MTTADDEAREHGRRRASIQRRLARVEAAISQWHAREANRSLPDGRRRTVAKPELSLAECLDQRRMLREELAQLARLDPMLNYRIYSLDVPIGAERGEWELMQGFPPMPETQARQLLRDLRRGDPRTQYAIAPVGTRPLSVNIG